MSREWKAALEKKRIVPFPAGRQLVAKELEATAQDLEEADDRFAHKRWKYVTITAYYAMFHAARALLYHRGYREKSHHFLSVAIEALYVDSGALSPTMARAFKNAMILREEADYHSDFSRDGAEMSLQAARDFFRRGKTDPGTGVNSTLTKTATTPHGRVLGCSTAGNCRMNVVPRPSLGGAWWCMNRWGDDHYGVLDTTYALTRSAASKAICASA